MSENLTPVCLCERFVGDNPKCPWHPLMAPTEGAGDAEVRGELAIGLLRTQTAAAQKYDYVSRFGTAEESEEARQRWLEAADESNDWLDANGLLTPATERARHE